MVVEQKEGHKSLVGLMAKEAGKRSGPAGQQVDGGGRTQVKGAGRQGRRGGKKEARPGVAHGQRGEEPLEEY